MKKQNGITLIALVVTIIILIILVGITINLTIGENGITSKAVQAREEMKKASLIENIRMEILENSLSENNQISEANVKALLGKFGTVIEKDGKIESLKLEDGTEIVINEIISEKIVYPNDETTTYIYTKEQFEEFRDSINEGQSYEGKVVKLMDNIDLQCDENDETSWWKNIGKESYPFIGTFDGNGYKISNIYMEDIGGIDSCGGGLFRTIKNATIKNVTVSGKIVIKDVGASAGIVFATSGQCVIENCCNQVNVCKETTGRESAGILGVVFGSTKVINSTNEATISGGNNTGGIIGRNYGNITIEGCKNKANIENTVGDHVGSIMGRDGGADTVTTIKDFINTGIIKGKYACGGAIGAVSGTANIDSFVNKGEVIEEGTTNEKGYAYAGGIIGVMNSKSNGTIKNSYNTTKITSKDWIAGGLIGVTGATNQEIINSYNIGEIDAKQAAGGICGGMTGATSDFTPSIEIKNCYQVGNLISENYKSGIVTRNCEATINIENGYYLNNTADKGIDNAAEGTIDDSTALTNEYMKLEEFVNQLNTNISNEQGLRRWKYTLNEYPTFE